MTEQEKRRFVCWGLKTGSRRTVYGKGGFRIVEREKVIKELQESIADAVYPDRPRKFMISLELAENALALLKAQEPKMVIGVAEIYKDIWLGNCPSCDQSIVSNVNKSTKYCRFCGQAVKWE